MPVTINTTAIMAIAITIPIIMITALGLLYRSLIKYQGLRRHKQELILKPQVPESLLTFLLLPENG